MLSAPESTVLPLSRPLCPPHFQMRHLSGPCNLRVDAISLMISLFPLLLSSFFHYLCRVWVEGKPSTRASCHISPLYFYLTTCELYIMYVAVRTSLRFTSMSCRDPSGLILTSVYIFHSVFGFARRPVGHYYGNICNPAGILCYFVND